MIRDLLSTSRSRIKTGLLESTYLIDLSAAETNIIKLKTGILSLLAESLASCLFFCKQQVST